MSVKHSKHPSHVKYCLFLTLLARRIAQSMARFASDLLDTSAVQVQIPLRTLVKLSDDLLKEKTVQLLLQRHVVTIWVAVVEREETRIVHFRKQASNFDELLMGMNYFQNVF